MKLFEELIKPENKKKFRELVKKYHPDNKETGNEEISKKLNVAKGKGDATFEKVYSELINKKPNSDIGKYGIEKYKEWLKELKENPILFKVKNFNVSFEFLKKGNFLFLYIILLDMSKYSGKFKSEIILNGIKSKEELYDDIMKKINDILSLFP